MSLRVLQLGPYPPPEGGISRNILAIRDELLARGHSSAIIATSQSSRIDKEGEVYHPRTAFEMLRLLSSLKYDVLHLHIGGEVSPRVLALAAACTFFGRNKAVLTLHSGGYPLTREAKAASPHSIRGRIFQQYSRIIAVNDVIADVFRRYGERPDRLKMIPPYSLKQPDETIAVPDAFARFYQMHSPVLLSVGGLEKDYDPLFLTDAMMDILKDLPNAGLMIVGGGSMRGEVESAIAANNLADSVFLAGNIKHAVTLHLMRDADIVLRTTLFDGDAISVREALFLGTPVIATDADSRPDGVHLIETGDKDALVNKIKEIVTKDDKDRSQCSPDDSNIKAVVDLYEELESN